MAGDTGEFMNIINTAVKMASMSSYRQAMLDAQAGVGHETSALSGKLPELFKDMSVSKTLGEDPVLSDPLMQPIVEKVRTAMKAKYPLATEADIKEVALEYIKDMGSRIGNPSQNTPVPVSSSEPNWDNIFGKAMG